MASKDTKKMKIQKFKKSKIAKDDDAGLRWYSSNSKVRHLTSPPRVPIPQYIPSYSLITLKTSLKRRIKHSRGRVGDETRGKREAPARLSLLV